MIRYQLKIKNPDALSKTLARLKSTGKKVVFTNGCFDIMHSGHVKYLETARNLGNILVVGLNSDSSVRSIKGNGRPINGQNDRAAVLAGLGCVDYVTIFADRTPEKLIRMLKPDILAKGADWKTADIVGADFVTARGGKVARIPFVRGRSTTTLIKKIRSAR